MAQTMMDINHGKLKRVRSLHRVNGDVAYSQLVPLGHKVTDLANALGRNARRRDNRLTVLQREALADFAKIPEFDPTKHLPHDIDIIRQWFLVFDKLFFFGSLNDYCVIEMEEKREFTAYRGICTSHHRRIPNYGYTSNDVGCTIRIVRQNPELLNLRGLFNDYLVTLIHEMCHAVLSIYPCDCVLKCQQERRKSKGTSHHTRTWQDIMANIDEATPFLIKQAFKLREDREAHLSTEVLSVPVRPTVKQVSSWTRAVNRLVGITKYRIQRIWGLSLRSVGKNYRRRIDNVGRNRHSSRRW